VDLTNDDEEMMETPASPSPYVSEDSEMETDEERDLLASPSTRRTPDSSEENSDDGFQHV